MRRTFGTTYTAVAIAPGLYCVMREYGRGKREYVGRSGLWTNGPPKRDDGMDESRAEEAARLANELET